MFTDNLEMKKSLKVKTSIDGFNNRLDTAEHRINGLEYI